MKFFWLSDLILLLKYYKVRFALALFVIVLGFSALVIFIILRSSVDAHLSQVFAEMNQGNFVAHIVPRSPQEKKSIQYNLSYPEIRRLIETIEIDSNGTMQMIPYQLSYEKAMWMSEALDAEMILIHPQLLDSLNLALESGRNLHQTDHYKKVVILGSNIARKLQQKGYFPLDETVVINNAYYQCIGVLKETVSNPLLDFDINRAILLDYSMLPYIGKGAYQSFYVQSSLLPSASQTKFRTWLQDHYQLPNVFIKDANMYMHAMMQQIDLTLSVLKWVAVMNLSLGALVLIIILGLLIQERIPEMGIRICLGALRGHLVLMFVREAMVLCLIGGIVGIVFGVPTAYILISKLDLLYEVHFFDILVILPASLVCGIVVGATPALIAARKDPVVLLN